MIPAGSQRAFSARSSSSAELADLVAEVGRVVAADRVVVGDRAAGGDDRARGRVLGRAPLGDRIGLLAAEHGEVQRRAGGIQVRDVAAHVQARQRGAHGAVEPLEVAPGGRGLERLDERAAVEQVVAQVRAGEARPLPRVARLGPERAARRRARACAPRPRGRARPASRTRAGSGPPSSRRPSAPVPASATLSRVSASSESRAMSGAIPSCSSSPQRLRALQERADAPAVVATAPRAAARAAPRA